MVPLLLLPLLWRGSLQEKEGYELQVQELVTVQEGLCIHVPCSFFYQRGSWFSSRELYTFWYLSEDGTNYASPVATNDRYAQVKQQTQGRFLLADPRTNSCSLSIRDSRKSDTGTYVFQVLTGYFDRYTYQDKKLTLKVTDLTQKPDIHIWGPLESGRPTQLSCSLPGSCEEGSPLIFSWVGNALDSLNLKTLRSSMLTFTPKPRDHGTTVTCLVTLAGPGVTTRETIQLNVSYAPRNLVIGVSYRNVTALEILQNTSSLPILEGEALRLLCVADSNPPAQLSWFQGSPVPNATPISRTTILELPRVGTGEEGQFTCQAQHPLGSQSISLSLSVVYAPRLVGPSCSWEDEGLRCSCSSRAEPAPSVRWQLGEGLLEENPNNDSYTITSRSVRSWANSSLRLRVGLNAGLRITCEAKNVHGVQSASVLLLPGKSISVSRVVPAALGGAGAMALLSLCLCLIFFYIVKLHRKQTDRRRKATNDEDPVMGTVTWVSDGFQLNPRPDGPPDLVSPTGDVSPLREEQDTQYAKLTFHGRKPWEPQDKEAITTCVYSKIKETRQ
ncbi:sialic acid-binding Ig-like lectin 5 isoform X3 [Artibeus jamaicensis]|uniref:sialic acid-binding Ig-like lectin 5 isoform X3 n=1 Tax=Artibeus jamaicensis TaxID=9417 RepID=UPI00235A8C32|nr:sialic acid-binding Ig-like lectin 5 isoform X3 [Artibeus jamaicensis]